MDYRKEFDRLVSEQQLAQALDFLEQNKIAVHDDAFYYANMGWVLNQLERYDEAYVYLSQGHARFPEDAWLCAQLGFTSNRIERLEEGRDLLLEALSMGQDEPWVHGELGWTYHALHEDEKAIRYYENALMEEPDNTWFLKQAAYSYRELGNDEDALYDLKKAHTLDPEDLEITMELIESLETGCEFEAQLELLDRIQGMGDEGWWHYEKGVACLQLKRYEEACELFKQAFELGRDDTGIHQAIGDAYMALSNKTKACEHYQKAISYYVKALERGDYEPCGLLWEMVLICRKMQDSTQEFSYLKQIEAIDLKHYGMLDGMAQYYSDQGDHEQAVQYLNRMLEIRSESDVWALLAWNLGRLSHHEEALTYLQKCEDAGRNDCWLNMELAWNHSRLEHYEISLKYYRQAHQQEPENCWIQSQIAWNLGVLKRHEEALELFLACLETIEKPEAWLYSNIGWNYHSLEQYEQASYFYEQARAAGRDDDWLAQQIAEVKTHLCEKA